MSNNKNMEGADLSEANLRGANLRGIKITRAQLVGLNKNAEVEE